jgi:hypothetical protein
LTSFTPQAFTADHFGTISSTAGLREKVADISRHGLDPIKAPVAKSDCGEREAAIIRRHELRPCDGHGRSPLRPEPRLGASAVHPFACGCDEQCGVTCDEASKLAPVAPKPAHPPSAITLPADASPRRRARRDTLVSCCCKCRTITQNPLRTLSVSGPPLVVPLKENGGEKKGVLHRTTT